MWYVIQTTCFNFSEFLTLGRGPLEIFKGLYHSQSGHQTTSGACGLCGPIRPCTLLSKSCWRRCHLGNVLVLASNYNRKVTGADAMTNTNSRSGLGGGFGLVHNLSRWHRLVIGRSESRVDADDTSVSICESVQQEAVDQVEGQRREGLDRGVVPVSRGNGSSTVLGMKYRESRVPLWAWRKKCVTPSLTFSYGILLVAG
jgi:hypothetical protein